MNRISKSICFVLLAAGMAAAVPQSSVSQYGITWTFSGAHETGQYANGDYWVLGPVTITSISPDYANGQNGWEVNPRIWDEQGFDGTTHDDAIENFNAALVPSLPYDATGGESIVKAIAHSSPTNHIALKVAAVLTVVSEIPPGNGATVFRPAYYGTEKTLHSVNDMDLSILPKLSVPVQAISLAEVEVNFQKVQLDHLHGAATFTGRKMHPEDNMSDYGASIAQNTADAVLALCLDYTDAQKKQAVINYVQAGLDYYYMLKAGVTWSASGGHKHGRKLPIVFAGAILDDAAIQAAVKGVGKGPLKDYDHTFAEDGHIYYSETAGRALFGDMKWAEGASSIDSQQWELKYWQLIYADKGNRLVRDPYGYIDGGLEPGGGYQFCCISLSARATGLAVLLVPGLRELWDNESYMQYADRWVNVGGWAEGDPCAPAPEHMTGDANAMILNGYGQTWGPDPANPGDCIRDTDDSDGIGRFPDKHGASKNAGSYGSDFSKNMWTLHRQDTVVTGITSPVGFDVLPGAGLTLSSNPVRGMAVISVDQGVHGGTVVVYNAAGALVTTLQLGRTLSVQWDGTNRSGIMVENGTYYIRYGESVTSIIVVK